MDQGIIVAMKRLYRRRFLEQVMVEIDEEDRDVGQLTLDNLRKYGEDVGTLTDNTLYAVGQTAWAGHNIASLGVKGVAKRVAKDTGKALVLQHDEKKGAVDVEEAEEATETAVKKNDAEQVPVRPIRAKKPHPLRVYPSRQLMVQKEEMRHFYPTSFDGVGMTNLSGHGSRQLSQRGRSGRGISVLLLHIQSGTPSAHHRCVPSQHDPSSHTLASVSVAQTLTDPSRQSPHTLASVSVAQTLTDPSWQSPHTLASSPHTLASVSVAQTLTDPSWQSPHTLASGSVAQTLSDPSWQSPHTLASSPHTLASGSVAQTLSDPSWQSPHTLASGSVAQTLSDPSRQSPHTLASDVHVVEAPPQRIIVTLFHGHAHHPQASTYLRVYLGQPRSPAAPLRSQS
ncbi:hypothetical protein GWK47_053225 [Chionoecetes opilio]|uniref:Uncharacterized protein n=1 Tax=Chionoecetes opilio TaxID=41210 RepID=A0A8J5CRD2_CHIOP|nr:hypothetical protein GWK47_053225 [Chionoecetes opilio]